MKGRVWRMAVHITTGYPNQYGDIATQLKNLQDVVTSLIDNVEWAVCHLDAGNVVEASSVKAQNIDTTQAKIKDAQIKNLTADKIKAGKIDLSKGITIAGSGGQMEIADNFISMSDSDGNLRVEMGTDDTGQFAFVIYSLKTDKDGNQIPAIYLDDDGEAVFSGTVQGGKITSDTSIDVTTDVHVGKNIYLNSSNYTEGIHFLGDTSKGSITVEDHPAGTLRVSNGLTVNGTLTAPKLFVHAKDIEAWLTQLENRVAALEQNSQ